MGFEHIVRVVFSWGVDLFVQFFLYPIVGMVVVIPAFLLAVRFEQIPIGVNTFFFTTMGLIAVVFVITIAIIYGGGDELLGFLG